MFKKQCVISFIRYDYLFLGLIDCFLIWLFTQIQILVAWFWNLIFPFLSAWVFFNYFLDITHSDDYHSFNSIFSTIPLHFSSSITFLPSFKILALKKISNTHQFHQKNSFIQVSFHVTLILVFSLPVTSSIYHLFTNFFFFYQIYQHHKTSSPHSSLPPHHTTLNTELNATSPTHFNQSHFNLSSHYINTSHIWGGSIHKDSWQNAHRHQFLKQQFPSIRNMNLRESSLVVAIATRESLHAKIRHRDHATLITHVHAIWITDLIWFDLIGTTQHTFKNKQLLKKYKMNFTRKRTTTTQ